MMPFRFLGLLCLVASLAFMRSASADDAMSAKLGQEAYAILNRSCFECHGPTRQDGSLRLDSREAMLTGGDSGATVVLEKLSDSELLRRIKLSKSDSEVMPKRGAVLTKGEVAKIERWLAAGAPWSDKAAKQTHWSYVLPKKVALPRAKSETTSTTSNDSTTSTKNFSPLAPSSGRGAGGEGAVLPSDSTPHPPTPSPQKTGARGRENVEPVDTHINGENVHPVDAFVVDRLNQEGLRLGPEADLRVLARRLYLDVIGLPPNFEQVEQFVVAANQNTDEAIDNLVDQLLQSPQYGDKWARPWLDAARYADSHGFQRDDLHEIWAYRDWVIRSLNEDMPFDRFTIEQLAGDLLPNPTESQLIATGFNRCAPCNVEAGTDPEENRFNQIVDRVNTLGYAWLGSSLECAQCHDHKYDPFTQKDYFGLFAFFNQTELEADRANPKVPGSIKFNGPYMALKEDPSQLQNVELESKIEAAKTRLASTIKRLSKPNPSTTAEITQKIALKPIDFESINGASHEVLEDNSILLHEDAPDTDTYVVTVALNDTNATGVLLDVLTDPSLPGNGPGRGDAKRPNFVLQEFEIYAIDNAGVPRSEKINLVDAVSDFSQNNFSPEKVVDGNEKTGWAISPQFFKSHWAAFRFADLDALKGVTQLQFRLIQNFGGARTIGRFKLSALMGDYTKALPTKETEDPRIAKLREQLEELEGQRAKKEKPKTLVMREIDQPRMSTMFARGDYRNPSDKVDPHAPKILHPYHTDGANNRLSLAKWLVSPENPLVARVIANRMWGEIFGIGLVSTPEDFGLKGEAPSHPELLDWLAADFVENGWSQKKLLQRILTSQTYRQSSRMTAEQLERDPNNVLLARGPRFRLPAESIRDNALAVAGLLSLKQFGPPIRPPQPDGLWKKVGGQAYDYEVSLGEDKYRRGVYVVLKRMSPYPSFITFDASARLACRVKRGRSNTPLQALTLLNDPVYVEAAEALAARVQKERPDRSLDEQLGYAFQLAVARKPADAEASTLMSLFELELKAHASDSKPVEAAWFAIASTLMNLDETITKE